MLRKNSKTVMLSKAQRLYFCHPSTHPAKNAGFAQDDYGVLRRVEAYLRQKKPPA